MSSGIILIIISILIIVIFLNKFINLRRQELIFRYKDRGLYTKDLDLGGK